MRTLLDESLPSELGALLLGHQATTVQRCGWSGMTNGRLLATAAARFEVLLTADRGIEYQQNLASLPIAVLIVTSNSNRIEDMARRVPAILDALAGLTPRSLRSVID